MKKLFATISIIVTLLLTSSCLLLDTNDNSALYDTEWVADIDTYGMKFYSSDEVLYFSPSITKSGTFSYNSLSSEITFSGLTLNYGGGYVEEIDGAILSDGILNVIWHKVGESENYKMEMKRVR